MELESKPFLGELELPHGLLQAVLARVEAAARRRARLAFAGFGSLAILSGGLLIAALSYAGQELYASGFDDYVSLFFTDSVARAHWQDILASLIAALPSAAILVILASVAALVWSIMRMPQLKRTRATA